MNNELLAQADPEISAAINDELTRQRNTLELIASENIVSPAVMEAMGSVLTNKYAEGLPGKRYYGGCWAVDEVEDLARDRERTERLTYALARRLGIPVISGSDTHQAFQYGCVVTRMERRCTTFDELFELVREGAYEIRLADDAAFRVKTAGYLKRALKEIDRLGGDYVATILAGQAL